MPINNKVAAFSKEIDKKKKNWGRVDKEKVIFFLFVASIQVHVHS